MKVLDLFSGLGGWSQTFIEHGHEVFRIDNDSGFATELCVDILEFQVADLPWKPDVIVASPPCETFSTASCGHHWADGKKPKTEAALVGMEIVRKTVKIIEEIQPRVAVIENPRGMLRKLHLIPGTPRTVWYCHFGEQRAKPTDLWGLPFPTSMNFRAECHNRRPTHDNECCCRDHEAAPRGARTGTQGMTSYAIKSVIPNALADELRIACEREGIE